MELLADSVSTNAVVLWLEDDLPPGPRGRRSNMASAMTDALKRQLRWLTIKVLVANLASVAFPGMTVTNLPGAGRQG